MKRTTISSLMVTVATGATLVLAGCGGQAVKELTDLYAKQTSQQTAATPATPEKQKVNYPMGELVGEPSDYSNKDNWYQVPKTSHAIDTIFFYPTTYNPTSSNDPAICDITNKSMREGVSSAYQQTGQVFEDSTNVYVPYYRQSSLASLKDVAKQDWEAAQLKQQRTDVYAALDYYFEHYNEGRPFIIAGHSQGSQMVSIALKDYFQAHPNYLKRMVAAYVVGYSITEADLKDHQNLKFAESSTDTNVIVSWNTEGPNNEDSKLVLDNAIAINPISWTRTDKLARSAENLGSRQLNAKGEYELLAPGYADAQVDTNRGVVISTQTTTPYVDLKPLGVSDAIFGTKSLHNGDYLLFYGSIKANVADRCNAWLKERGEKTEETKTASLKAIDLNSSYYTQAFLDITSARTSAPIYNAETKSIAYVDGVWTDLSSTHDKLLAMDASRITEMDRYGVSQALLTSSPGIEQIGGADGISLCTTSNNAVSDAMKAYPSRFLGSAVLPVDNVDAAVAELERCVNDLGFVAWHTHSNYGGTHLNDAAYRPLLKRAAELGVTVCISPAMPKDARANALGAAYSGAGMGYTVDVMETLTALITSGVFDELPDLKVVVNDYGEGLPFMLSSLDKHLAPGSDASLLNKQPASYYFKHNIWVTTSCNTSTAAFVCAKEVLGIDHLLLATNYPYESVDDEMTFLNSVSLTEDERAALYHGNAEKLLGLKA